jgi:hypothetical protein
MTTPGGKRSQTHSEFHHFFFTSLGISIPANIEHCRAQVWPVLTREKNSQKEVLVHSRNQTLPNLPIGIKITGSVEEDWSLNPTLEDFIQCVATGLEESMLSYKLPLKDHLSFEWSWREELSRGGMESTILAHINAGSNAISIQNKRHLHWIKLESITAMNNEVKFIALAHNLLLKTRAQGEDR